MYLKDEKIHNQKFCSPGSHWAPSADEDVCTPRQERESKDFPVSTVKQPNPNKRVLLKALLDQQKRLAELLAIKKRKTEQKVFLEVVGALYAHYIIQVILHGTDLDSCV